MGSPHYYIETYKNGVLIRKEGIKCRDETIRVFCRRYYHINEFAPGHDLDQADDVLIVMCSKCTGRGHRTIHAAITYSKTGEGEVKQSLYTVMVPVFFNDCDPTYEELSKLVHDPNMVHDECSNSPSSGIICFLFDMLTTRLACYQVMQDLKSCKYRKEVRMVTCTLKSNHSSN